MIAVIFEVLPRPERRQDYLDIASDLAPGLAKDRWVRFDRAVRVSDNAGEDLVVVVLAG